MRVLITIMYDGAGYCGWQVQPGQSSVQGALEEAVFRLTGKKAPLIASGRTDAGVHESPFVASAALDTTIPLDRLPAALNSVLPDDIVVKRAAAVSDGFDARFDCRRKEYTYIIHNSPLRDPFYLQRACFYPKTLDVSRMAAGASHITGKKDFAAFKNEGTEVKSTVRHVFYCDVTRELDKVFIRVCADGFMYNMVRNIAGTLIYTGIHKLEPEGVKSIIESKQRSEAGPTAPACGLYLTKVFYGMEELDG